MATKDCQQYREYMENAAAPGFVPDPSCPWEQVAPVGHFAINGVKLAVPRKYLWADGKKPDGPADGLNIMFTYPDRKPGSADGDQRDNIVVLVSSAQYGTCPTEQPDCQNAALSMYRSVSGMGGYLRNPTQFPGNQLIQTNRLDDLGLDVYWRKMFVEMNRTVDDVLVRGSPETPDFALICGNVESGHHRNPRCDSYFQAERGLLIHYGYRRIPHLSQYQEIDRKVKAKIQSFIEKESP